MSINYIALAIPVFLLLIGIELLAALFTGKISWYRINDTVNDLSMGVLSRVAEVFMKTALAIGYIYLYENYRFVDIPANHSLAWIACFIGVDFFYYWFHRMSHEVAIIWGSHIPHHQSEEYNLAVALRQGSFQGAFSWVFYLPLALLGFPVIMFAVMSQFNTLYQFWIHTRFIGKLGPFELIFNTPSHHRVHHGRNPAYIDKNHGGTLIIWDKLFGTFAPEKEEVVYGIVKPLHSWNPVWANFHYWKDLFATSMSLHGIDRFLVWFKKPGWGKRDEQPTYVSPDTVTKFDTKIPFSLNLYVIIHFTLTIAAFVYFIDYGHLLTVLDNIFIAVFIVVSLLSIGWILEGRVFSTQFEMFRIIVTNVVYLGLYNPELLPGTLVFIGTTVSLLWMERCRSILDRAPKSNVA